MESSWKLTERFISASETKVAFIKCLLCAIYFTLHICVLFLTATPGGGSGFGGVCNLPAVTDLSSGEFGNQTQAVTSSLERTLIQLSISSSFFSSPQYHGMIFIMSIMTLFSQRLWHKSVVLFLEYLTKCMGHLCFAASPLSGTWSSCIKQRRQCGEGYRTWALELGLCFESWFFHIQLCFLGQTTWMSSSTHQLWSWYNHITYEVVARITWAGCIEAMANDRIWKKGSCLKSSVDTLQNCFCCGLSGSSSLWAECVIEVPYFWAAFYMGMTPTFIHQAEAKGVFKWHWACREDCLN